MQRRGAVLSNRTGGRRPARPSLPGASKLRAAVVFCAMSRTPEPSTVRPHGGVFLFFMPGDRHWELG